MWEKYLPPLGASREVVRIDSQGYLWMHPSMWKSTVMRAEVLYNPEEKLLRLQPSQGGASLRIGRRGRANILRVSLKGVMGKFYIPAGRFEAGWSNNGLTIKF